MTIRAAFSLGVELAGLDRLMVIHKVSIISRCRSSYQSRLRSVPGVETVTHNTWFGGVYQDPANFFATIAVEPEPYFGMYPEIHLPPEQMKAWLADRQGAVVGRDLAKRFGWKIGDRIPIRGTIYRTKSGSDAWEFNIVGIYDGDPGVRQDATSSSATTISTRPGRTATGSSAGTSSRSRIRRSRSRWRRPSTSMFANSSAETKTTTEKGFVDGFAKQVGDIGSIMIAILVGRALHDPARRRQHDGAGGARAHQRARRAEDARLFERADPDARARRVAVHRDRGRRARSRRGLGASSSAAIRQAACCRRSCCQRRDLADRASG